MLLATLAAMPSTVSPIDSISALYHGTAWEAVFGPFFEILVVGVFFFVMKWLLARSLDRCFQIVCAGRVVCSTDHAFDDDP
jgi:hypothetical protein